MKKMISIILITIMSVTALTGCGTLREEKYDLTKVSDSVISGNNDFAFRIFQVLNKEDEEQSIFLSPFSISAALTMTYNGAETSTKEAMEKVLGFTGIDRAAINESYKNLINYLGQMDKKVELNIGNSIWIKEGQVIKEEFIKGNENNFNAEVDTLDFSDSSAADTINGWISDATKDKIDKMIEPPIPADVIMYLINAIYFKGEWSEQFDPERTYSDSFHKADGSEQTVDMMNRSGLVEYASGDYGKAVRLPYGDGKSSMYLMLPQEGTDINGWINSMTIDQWENIRNSVTETEDVRLIIPRFKLEYGIKNLNDSLAALGMEEAFGTEADFSGIRDGIYISRVLHKAVIEVNEEGSEAAAATVVEIQESAATEPISFVADRPFVFFITEDTTDTILFMGKVLDIGIEQ